MDDRNVVRELAKRYMEIASDEVNGKRIARIKAVNGLKPSRPPVWIDEIPWHEMDIDGQLTLTCENPELRQMEFFFRTMLYRWKYFQADMVAEGCYYIPKAYHATKTGAEIKESTLSTDQKNHIVSHHFEDQLDSDEKVEALRCPVITAKPEADSKRAALLSDMVGDIIPIKARGHYIYYAPWDEISMLRGVEPILFDMIERPELLHKTIGKFTEIGLSRYKQMEELGLLECHLQSLHCTPPYVEDLPADDFDGGKVRLKDIWFRGMAQMFSTVSPDALEEFDLQYMRRLSDQCGLTYYGCCEPLDNKLEKLSGMKNLRKVGVSPWSNVRLCAERMGGDYVFARKPNPAFVAGTFNREAVAAETTETIEACLANGCPYELVLKDISTVSYNPYNLIQWTNTVKETLDRYYD